MKNFQYSLLYFSEFSENFYLNFGEDNKGYLWFEKTWIATKGFMGFYYFIYDYDIKKARYLEADRIGENAWKFIAGEKSEVLKLNEKKQIELNEAENWFEAYVQSVLSKIDFEKLKIEALKRIEKTDSFITLLNSSNRYALCLSNIKANR